MRPLLAISTLAAALALPPEPEFALQLVEEDIADRLNARCLSGTRPGYYYRPPAPGAAVTKWKMHFEGGGWCYTPESCFYRLTAGGPGGSPKGWLANSSVWPPHADEMVAPWGMMAWNDTDTPGWNSVWINYCDGSSLSSDLDEPIVYNGTKLYMRGRAILDAVLESLERRNGLLSRSTDVIISGTSAGGLAAYLHAEEIRSRIPPSAAMVAIPDAGFFVDEPDVHGDYSFRENVQQGWAMYNASGGVNSACVAHYPEEEQWKCFMAQYTMPFITRVPIYVLNSAIDAASMGMILRIGCSLDVNSSGSCSKEQVARIQQWRVRFLQLLDEWVFKQPAHAAHSGSWITSCPQHEEVCRDPDWQRVRIGGSTDQSNFGRWLSGDRGPQTRIVDGPWPNPTCQALPMHGPC